MKYFIQDQAGNNLIDKVIKLEEINSQLPPLLISLGIPFEQKDIPHVSKRDKKLKPTYVKYYNAMMQSLVARRYDYEIGKYSYKFAD